MIQQTNNIPAIYTEAAETIKTAILQGQYEALKVRTASNWPCITA